MANYEIDPAILKKYLPATTQLDTRNGKHYVSLIGFMFLNTKVKGIKIPFHSIFPEVNLRFYVKHRSGNEWKRGVVFINEFVPKAAITFVANTLFKEKYVTYEMEHTWDMGDKLSISYEWKNKNEWNKLEVLASSNSFPIKPGSEEEFITEHYWGYSKINDHKTGEYEVAHPRWLIYPVEKYKIDCSFSECYGADFRFLDHAKPVSVLLAEGSDISVYNKKIINA